MGRDVLENPLILAFDCLHNVVKAVYQTKSTFIAVHLRLIFEFLALIFKSCDKQARLCRLEQSARPHVRRPTLYPALVVRWLDD